MVELSDVSVTLVAKMKPDQQRQYSFPRLMFKQHRPIWCKYVLLSQDDQANFCSHNHITTTYLVSSDIINNRCALLRPFSENLILIISQPGCFSNNQLLMVVFIPQFIEYISLSLCKLIMATSYTQSIQSRYIGIPLHSLAENFSSQLIDKSYICDSCCCATRAVHLSYYHALTVIRLMLP